MLWNSDHSGYGNQSVRFGVAREDWKDLGGTVLQPSIPRTQKYSKSIEHQWDLDYHSKNVDDPKDFLIHYGVPGMRWGVITKE